MRPEQNTTLNAKKEQFITAYISGNALKQEHCTLKQENKCSKSIT